MNMNMSAEYLHAHLIANYIHRETDEKVDGYDLCDRFDEMLNDAYPEVEYCGFTATPADALKELDPVAYRCYFVDWLGAEGWEDA